MPKNDLSLEERIALVEEHLIGLWRFRELKRKPTWCATYHFRGHYYDVSGKKSPGRALEVVREEIEELKAGKVKRKKK